MDIFSPSVAIIWTVLYISFGGQKYSFWMAMYSAVELQVIEYVDLISVAKCFSKVTVPINSPTKNSRVFILLNPSYF